MSDDEKWYDEEIAPALLDIGRKVQERGRSIVAVVEFEPGERGETKALAADAGLEMVMLSHCARTGRNLDGYVIGIKRYCAKNGIATDSSLVLTRTFPPQQGQADGAAGQGEGL